MISLRSWFDWNARLPWVALVLVLLHAQATYIALAISERRVSRETHAQRIVAAIAAGLVQQNRTVIESTLGVSLDKDGFRAIFICANFTTLIGHPYRPDACRPDQPSGLGFRKRVVYPIPGFQDHLLLLEVDEFQLIRDLAALVAVGVLTLAFAFGLSRRAIRKFNADIVAPIAADFSLQTELRITELDQLRQRRDRLAILEAEKATTQLARQVAHDIRSPVTALNVFVKMKRQSLTSEESNFLQAAADRINSIADDLLAAGRGSSDNRPNASSLTLKEAVKTLESVVTEKRAIHPNRHFKLASIDCDLDGRVDLPRAHLARVVSNVLDNSLHATNPNQAIQITTRLPTPDVLELSFRDEGNGMDAETLARVRRLEGSFSKPSGHGLGLSHLAQTVAQVGGTWSIDSVLGAGTSVVMRFPVIAART